MWGRRGGGGLIKQTVEKEDHEPEDEEENAVKDFQGVGWDVSTYTNSPS